MKTGELDSKVNMVEVICESFSAGSMAAWRLIQDGRVLIDGHIVLPCWAVGHWSVRQLTGRVLIVKGHGQVRLFGSRPCL